jgi:THO complex subunit 4
LGPQDLFSATVGPVRRAIMVYNSVGRSTGVANVVFARFDDSRRAYEQYNDRLIDGSPSYAFFSVRVSDEV